MTGQQNAEEIWQLSPAITTVLDSSCTPSTESRSGPINVVGGNAMQENKNVVKRLTDEEFGQLVNQCVVLASEGYAGMIRSLDSMMGALLGVPPEWDPSKPLPPKPRATDADV